ncbi:MAG: hypothetical protein AAFN10_17700 [Bacteroidota bacterium]
MLRLLCLSTLLTYGFLRAQLPMAGALDENFGKEGIAALPFEWKNQASFLSAVLPDQHIWVIGPIEDRDGNVGIVQLDENGDVDTEWGYEGRKVLRMRGSIADLKQMDDGRILLLGTQISDQERDFVVWRLLPNGQADSTFGRYGRKTINLGGWDEGLRMELLSEGRILLAGTSYKEKVAARNFAFACLDSAGRPSLEFGLQGKRIVDIGKEDELESIAIDNEGRIFFAGTCRPERFREFVVGRLLPEGKIDHSFNYSGQVRFHTGEEHDYCAEMVVLPDGRMRLLGHSRIPERGTGFDLVLVGLDEHGYLEETFGQKGQLYLDFGGNEYATAFRRQADGRLMIVGSSNRQPILARLYENGNLDPSFGDGGSSKYKIGGEQNDGPRFLNLQLDGKMLLTGMVKSEPSIIRLHGNPAPMGLETALGFDWNKASHKQNHQVSAAWGNRFELEAWSQLLAGPDANVEAFPHSAAKELLTFPSFVAHSVHFAFGENLKLTIIWDDEETAHYYVNNVYFQSVPLGTVLIPLIPHLPNQKPVQTANNRQKSILVQRGLH